VTVLYVLHFATPSVVALPLGRRFQSSTAPNTLSRLSPVRSAVLWLSEQLLVLLELIGLPVLFVIFVLKGALIGKPLSTTVFLPGYILATGASYAHAAVTVLVVTAGYMLGQLALYGGIRQYGPSVGDHLGPMAVNQETNWDRRITRWFDRYGGPTIFMTNFVPWIRGLLTVPAATSGYPLGRYLFYMGSSTFCYHVLYVSIPLLGVALI